MGWVRGWKKSGRQDLVAPPHPAFVKRDSGKGNHAKRFCRAVHTGVHKPKVVSGTHGQDDNRASKASAGKNANPGKPKRILEPCD